MYSTLPAQLVSVSAIPYLEPPHRVMLLTSYGGLTSRLVKLDLARGPTLCTLGGWDLPRILLLRIHTESWNPYDRSRRLPVQLYDPTCGIGSDAGGVAPRIGAAGVAVSGADR